MILAALGVRSERTGEVRVDALSDAVTQIEGQSSLVANLGIKATTLLKRMRALMYPEETTPATLEGLVAAFGDDEDPLGDYSRAQSTSDALRKGAPPKHRNHETETWSCRLEGENSGGALPAWSPSSPTTSPPSP